MMPKRMSDGCDGGRPAKPPRRRHLYLVLDDWSSGYTVRKIDLSAHAHPGHQLAPAVGWEGSIVSFSTVEQVLPSPIFRFEAERGLPMYFAGAFGTKIMAMHPRDDQEGLITAFDVRRRAVVFCPRPIPRPKQDLRHSYPFYIPMGNKLFAFSESFQVLNPSQPNDLGRQCCARSWNKLAEPPFDSNFVASYAVHPDGRTIFVSIGRLIAPATFSFQMSEEDMEGSWEALGEWELPFEGGAHFDANLNAWVGLSACPDTIGHLSVCDLIPARRGQCPSWKFSKETFFSEDPAERHIGATLVYMGHDSRFCLVECVYIEDKHLAAPSHKYKEESPVPFHYQFRVSTFSLEYENGDLTAGDSRQIRYYRVPREATFLLLKCPVAFLM